MKTYSDCISCFERQVRDVCDAASLGTEKSSEVMDSVRNRIQSFSMDRMPIEMAVEIHDLVREASGENDLYRKQKMQANRAAGACVPIFTRMMACSMNSLSTAVKLAIAGNIIDCGAYGMRMVSIEQLSEVIHDSVAQALCGSTIDEFKQLIRNAERILYIGDNAGECFFDVPLLKLLPADRLTYAVRGGPILNDATKEDARAAGIDRICSLVDTGDNAPGVLLERCSEEFRRIFDQSDLIISKGQGNYESLSGLTHKTIVFLTKVKCDVIAGDIGYELNSSVMKIKEGFCNEASWN